MKILITGGAGYIGSTIASALLDKGHTPVILDSLAVGKEQFTKGRIFYQGDIADKALLERIKFEHPDLAGTIHCAALIVVPESVARPFEYYWENVAKSMALFKNLIELGLSRIVFSSSASIYDVVPGFMVTENSPLNPSSPYARTKYMMEMVLQDFCAAYSLQGIALRYFNPIGADPKLRSGIHAEFPSHVLGKLVDVAVGKLPEFQLTGVNWPTRDGSGIRDYIHVWDLANAHVAAMEKFDSVFANSASNTSKNYQVINLGTGMGVTVKEIIGAFTEVFGKQIPVSETDPRPGDVAGSFANADTAERLIAWKATTPLTEGIKDALRWSALREQILGYP